MGDGSSSVPDSQIVARATEWIRRQQNAQIDYAQLADGFPMTEIWVQVLRDNESIVRLWPTSVGFFLPGDSLLFTIGVVAGAGQLNLVAIILLLTCACLLGDWSGYMLGRRAGPASRWPCPGSRPARSR